MVQTVPGSVLIQAAAYELLNRLSSVSIPAALLGSRPGGLTRRHADGRVHRQALALPKLPGPSPERSGQLVLRDPARLSDHVTRLCFLSLCFRPQPVRDRTAASRIPVVSAGRSEPRLPRPPPALRYAAALSLISSLMRPAVTPVSSPLISS